MALDQTLALLKATADQTRLRLLALLVGGEATVGELVEVLGQSQPRVSRHLRILSAAGLVSHFRDGHWVYYRLESGGALRGLAGEIVGQARVQDELIAADHARMAGIRRRRERYALSAPGSARPARAAPPGERPDDTALGQALADALGVAAPGDVLDVGVGSGALLRHLAPRARSAVGIDISRPMRVLARSRLQVAGLAHCTIRAGDVHALPFPDLAFDVVVLDEVLSASRRPAGALAEALRVLRPSGRLLVLDRVRPAARRLTAQGSQAVLFENQLRTMLQGLGLRCGPTAWFPGRAPEFALITATATPSLQRTGTDER